MWFFALYFNEKVCFSLPTPFFLRSSTGFFFVGFPELGFSHSAGTNGGGKKKTAGFHSTLRRREKHAARVGGVWVLWHKCSVGRCGVDYVVL